MKNLIGVLFVMLISLLFGCKDAPVTNIYYSSTDSLSDPNIKPKVIFTNPANGAVGPFNNDDVYNSLSTPQIVIQFNKLMDDYNLGGGSGSVRLTSDKSSYPLYLLSLNNTPGLSNVLIFSLGYKYLANAKYTVTVDTTLFDVHGYRLSAPYVFSYLPEPQFRVYSCSPNSYNYPDGIYPGSFSPITLNLNSKIDSTFFSKIQISPPIAGHWAFNVPYYYSSDSTVAYFSSTDTLLFDTKYSVTVPAGAMDVDGLATKAPFQSSFVTQPFEVSSSGWSSITGPGGFMVMSDIYFSFNATIDTSSVRSSIFISPNLQFNLSFLSVYGGYMEIDVRPNTEQMQRNTTYKITINNTLRSSKGTYLKNSYSTSVATGS
jgi:Bacterial Ig-like domain